MNQPTKVFIENACDNLATQVHNFNQIAESQSNPNLMQNWNGVLSAITFLGDRLKDFIPGLDVDSIEQLKRN